MTVRILATGLADPEGPVHLGDAQWLLTEMGVGSITQIDSAGKRKTRTTTARPNGLAVDADGVVWIAESIDAKVMRLDPASSEAVTVAITASGEPLLWPNDLCFGPDGTLYVTDSGMRFHDFGEMSPAARYDRRIDGKVLAVDPLTGEAEILDRGLQFANGIAVGPNDEHLYVAETLTGLIHRYPLGDVSRATRETFGNVLQADPKSYGDVAGPDGIAFDAEGTLLVAVLTQGTLTSLDRSGDVLTHMALPDSFPTNVAFAGPTDEFVVVTGGATGSLLAVDWGRPGLDLHRHSFAT